jgi:proteasome lid subunit RPN8/RPN11
MSPSLPAARRPLQLPRVVREAMLQHCRQLPQEEVCGLLGGRGASAGRYYPVRNIAADRRREFLMEPEEQIDAMRSMRERDESLVAIFHSHPDSPAVPSAVDLALAAYPDTIYVIASAVREEPDMNAYYYDGKDFEQIDIHMT